MAEYRPPRKRPRRLRTYAFAAAAFLVGAFVTATVAAVVTTHRVDASVEWVADLFRGDGAKGSEAEIVIGKVFRAVRTSEIWEGRPTLYPASRRYLVDHFHEYDPREGHGSFLLPQEPVVSPAALAVATPHYAGNRITLLGKVRLDSLGAMLPTESHVRLKRHGKNVGIPNASFTAQIAADGNRNSPLAYVEYASAASPPLAPGQWVLVVGVPIARGGLKLNDGGFAAGAYVIAGSIEPVSGPNSVRKYLGILEAKLDRQRKRCKADPSTWWCKQIERTTGHL